MIQSRTDEALGCQRWRLGHRASSGRRDSYPSRDREGQAPRHLGLRLSVSTPFLEDFLGCPTPPSRSPLPPTATAELTQFPGGPVAGGEGGGPGGQRRGWAALDQHGHGSSSENWGLQVPGANCLFPRATWGFGVGGEGGGLRFPSGAECLPRGQDQCHAHLIVAHVM